MVLLRLVVRQEVTEEPLRCVEVPPKLYGVDLVEAALRDPQPVSSKMAASDRP
jgi:hypothetical protein